jgi:hypothetical protein
MDGGLTTAFENYISQKKQTEFPDAKLLSRDSSISGDLPRIVLSRDGSRLVGYTCGNQRREVIHTLILYAASKSQGDMIGESIEEMLDEISEAPSLLVLAEGKINSMDVLDANDVKERAGLWSHSFAIRFEIMIPRS